MFNDVHARYSESLPRVQASAPDRQEWLVIKCPPPNQIDQITKLVKKKDASNSPEMNPYRQ